MMTFLKFVAPRLIGQGVGFVQRLPLPLVTLIIGIVLGLSSMGYLWYQQPSCKERAAVAALELERQARVDAEELISDRTRTIERLRKDLHTLREQVDTVVPDSRACDLGPDVGRLLNDARSR